MKQIRLIVLSSFVCSTLFAATPVEMGIDVLESQDFSIFQGKQVGLITNHTGITKKGKRTIDVLFQSPQVRLVAIFSPEHGLSGYIGHGEEVSDTLDPKTGLPIYSLYGEAKKPTPVMLNGIDVLVFDMQDVGARFYTYLSTMGLALEAASERKIQFVVLDRPNPMGGMIIEGPLLDKNEKRLTAFYSVPIRHGMTAGEIATWYNSLLSTPAVLTVIPMSGWQRRLLGRDIRYPFVPPSPNIRNTDTPLLYAGVGLFEATNVSVGRGTDMPFYLLGAPWMSKDVLRERIKSLHFPGLQLKAVEFTPQSDLYAGEKCAGIRFEIEEASLVRSVDAAVEFFFIFHQLYADHFQPRWPEVEIMTGSDDLQKAVLGSGSAASVLDRYRHESDEFEKARQPFLLY